MKKIGQKIHKWSVTAQVILVITVLILPMNVIAVVFASQVHDAFLDERIASVQRVAEIYMYELDRRIYSADTYNITEVDTNVHVLELRRHIKGKPFKREANFYWQKLNDRVRYALDADGYFFGIGNEAYLNVALNSAYNENRREITKYLAKMCETETSRYWVCRKIGGQKWMIHVFSLGEYYYGSLINLSDLEQQILESIEVDQAKVIFSEQSESLGGKEQSEIIEKAEKADIYLHIFFPHHTLERQMPLAKQIWLWIPFIYFTCIPFVIMTVNRIVIRPVKQVNYAMEQLALGNTEYRISEKGENREAKELRERFNSMADQLKELRIQIYESELEKLDIEATNLRLQVNPHFLMNCLNIIFSLARSGKNTEIKSFTKYLADYLRFSLWHTDGKICLAEEMRCVENYLEIQKIRFPGTFIYLQNISVKAEMVEIPSLLILNFVENTMKYALQMGKEIEILVSVRIEEKSLIISVCDTGNGMDEKMLKLLQDGGIPEDEAGKHIGIWNCRRRLRMLYEGEAYMSITSRLGEGTQVFIKLPLEERIQDEK